MGSYTRYVPCMTFFQEFVFKMAASAVHAQLSSCQLSVPQGGDKVYKDECVYSFDTPVSTNTTEREIFLIL